MQGQYNSSATGMAFRLKARHALSGLMSCMTCSASTLGDSSASLAACGVSCRWPGDDDEGDDVDAAEHDDARALRYK
jgi:hypothetical protein